MSAALSRAVAWPVAGVVSVGAHAVMLALVALAIRPEPFVPQALPEARLNVEAREVARAEAASRPARGDEVAAADGSGAAVSGAAIAESRARPAAPAADRLAAAVPVTAPQPAAAAAAAALAALPAAAGERLDAAANEAPALAAVTPVSAVAAPSAPAGVMLGAARPAATPAAAAPPAALPLAAAARPAAAAARPVPRAAAAAPLAPDAAMAPQAETAATPLPGVAPEAARLAAAAAPADAAVPAVAAFAAAPALAPPSDGLVAAAPAHVAVPDSPAAAEALPDSPAAGEALPDSPAAGEALPDSPATGAALPDSPAVGEALPDTPAAGEALPDSPAAGEALPGRPPGALAAAAPALGLPADRATASLAFAGGDGGAVDALSIAAFAAFTRPAAAAVGQDPVRDGVAAALSSVACARLQAVFDPDSATLAVQGHVPDDSARAPVLAALQAQVGGSITVADRLLVLPEPQCGALGGIAAVGLPQSTAQLSDPRIVGPDAHAREYRFTGGQALTLDLMAPDYPAVVYVDFFDAAGNVIHLQPNEIVPLERLSPRQEVTIGAARPDGFPFLSITVGPPYGQEIAVAFAASAPLYVGLRPTVEPAAPYLAFLRERVAAARAADPGFKGEWVYFFVATAAE